MKGKKKSGAIEMRIVASAALRSGGGFNGPLPQRERIDGELRRIMRGTRPRKYGEMPRDAGGFERLAPGAEYDGLCRMKRRR